MCCFFTLDAGIGDLVNVRPNAHVAPRIVPFADHRIIDCRRRVSVWPSLGMVILLGLCLIPGNVIFAQAPTPFGEAVVQPDSAPVVSQDDATMALPAVASLPPALHLRMATYNIAHARGNESGPKHEAAKMKNLKGIVQLLKQERLDVIGFTEISSGDLRARFRNQPRYIAKKLGFQHVYAENLARGPFGLVTTQGNAVVSRYPILSSQNHKLFKSDPKHEQRSCLESLLDLGNGRRLRFMVCHLSTKSEESAIQMDEIWKLVASSTTPVLLVGDFNSRPGHERTKLLAERMQDTTTTIDTTYMNKPGVKIDYHFLYGPLTHGLARVVGFEEGYSDHGCLINDYWWPRDEHGQVRECDNP